MADSQDRFYALIWPLADVVLRTAQVLCARSSADAEDLAQETLLKAYRALDQFQEGTDARAWLLTILRRTHIDRVRQQKSRGGQLASLDALEFDLAGPEKGPEPLDPAAWFDPGAMLAQFSDGDLLHAIQELPEALAWSLLLVDVEGLDLLEASNVMDVPVGTVKSRLHRGRAALRERLERARTTKRD